MSSKDTIIVVGATPVGLSLTLGLLKRGLDVALLEPNLEIAASEDTCVLYPSTLEMLDAVDRLQDLGATIDRQQYWNKSAPKLAAELSYDLLYDFTKYPFRLVCRKSQLVDVLVQEIRALSPHAIRTGHQLEGIRHTADGVEVSCRTAGGEVRLAGRYLVGADGPESVVRTLEGIGRDTLYKDHQFVVVECKADIGRRFPGIGQSALLLGEQSLASVTQLSSCVRIVFQLIPQSKPQDVADSDPRALMKRLLGDDAEFEILRSYFVSSKHGVSKAYSSGRVLLAGCAAHAFDTPVNDLGLNIGLHDARHLADAIERACAAADDLAVLAAYAQERRAYGLWTMSHVSNAYYDVVANSAQALKFGAYETRMGKLAATQTTAQTFLLRENLMESRESAAAA
jgi:3-(3-hydroxy-phenyl)propionate hydroxylase